MTTAAVVAVAGAISTLDRPDGVRGWSGPCPCADPALCHPIDRPGNSENVYVFHTAKGGRHGNGNDWRSFDWSIITTICVFGKIDPLLLCHAHAHGARVTLGNGGPPPVHWNDTNAVDAWVNKSVASVTAAYADGINIDIESTVTAGTQAAALTAVAAKAAQAMHAANPHSHVSFDIPSAGMLQEGPCGSQYGREYDFQALANALDFLVVMDYDSNDPRGANPGPFLSSEALADLTSSRAAPLLRRGAVRRAFLDFAPRLRSPDSVTAPVDGAATGKDTGCPKPGQAVESPVTTASRAWPELIAAAEAFLRATRATSPTPRSQW